MYSKTHIQGSFENIKSILFLLKVYTLVIIWMKCLLIDLSIVRFVMINTMYLILKVSLCRLEFYDG